MDWNLAIGNTKCQAFPYLLGGRYRHLLSGGPACWALGGLRPQASGGKGHRQRPGALSKLPSQEALRKCGDKGSLPQLQAGSRKRTL